MFRVMIIFLFYLAVNHVALGFPKPHPTTLPIPERFLMEDPENANNVFALKVYQDSNDENQYYYFPPFHIRQYQEGATNPFVSAIRIEHYADVDRLLQERDDYFIKFYEKIISEWEPRVEKSYLRLIEAQEKFQLAIENGNPEIIKLWKDALENAQSWYDYNHKQVKEAYEIKKGTLPIPDEMQKRYDHKIVSLLLQEGIDVSFEGLFGEALFKEISRATDLLKKKPSGFLTASAYAGFSKDQLEGLRRYKALYAPDIKVTLLSLDNINVFGLNEAKEGDKTGAGDFNMVYNVNGAGDYLGMTLYMDLTIEGGLQFSKHLGPFILPVGIKGEFDRYLWPTEAVLSCDFTNGFAINGRADVRDGAVIFDNDLTDSISPNDSNEGGCSLDVKSGDKASAELLALKELEKKFDELNIKRTLLSKEEKDAYYKGVVEDIKNNRRSSKSGNIARTLFSVATFGLSEIAITGFSYLADFHWHTNKQNVENLSKVKFSKKISIKGHEKITQDLPTSLCLVYNPVKHAYDRCTEEEFMVAKTMQQAGKEASLSEVCKGITDPFECGKRRDEILSREQRYFNVKDNQMVNEI